MNLHKLLDTAWLKRAYVTQKLSTLFISKLLNCSEGIVYYRLLKAGIKIRNRFEAQAVASKRGRTPKGFTCKVLNHSEILFRMHHKERKTPAQIARELGCGHCSVTLALKRHHIEKRKYVSKKSPDPRLNDREKLYDVYVRQGLSANKIGHLWKRSHVSIARALRRTGIPIRKR